MNGKKKLASPTATASFHLTRKTNGSSSAPARKVRTMAPTPDRNFTQDSSVPSTAPPMAAPMINCAMVPTTISESAVEIPSQIDVRLATSASESHRAASAHTPVMIVLAIGCRLVMDEVDQDVSALANWTFGPPADSSACFLGRNNREETVVGQF